MKGAPDELDVELAEAMGDFDIERGQKKQVFFRDPSGLILRPDRWYEPKEFWGRSEAARLVLWESPRKIIDIPISYDRLLIEVYRASRYRRMCLGQLYKGWPTGGDTRNSVYLTICCWSFWPRA